MFDYIAHKVLGLVFFLSIYICKPYMLYVHNETWDAWYFLLSNTWLQLQVYVLTKADCIAQDFLFFYFLKKAFWVFEGLWKFYI